MISTLICAALCQEMFGAKFHSRAEFYAAFKKIQDGMTTSQVRDILGVPDFVDRTYNREVAFSPDSASWRYGAKSQTDFPTLGWVEFSRGKVAITSKVIFPAPSEKVISETELRASLREVDKHTSGQLGDTIQLRKFFRKKGLAKTRAILQTYFNSTFIFDNLEWFLRLVSTNSGSVEVKSILEKIEKSYPISNVLISGFAFSINRMYTPYSGGPGYYDVKELIRNDACISFDRLIKVPRNPFLLVKEFNDWLQKNPKYKDNADSSVSQAIYEVEQMIRGFENAPRKASLEDLIVYFDRSKFMWQESEGKYTDGTPVASAENHAYNPVHGYFDKDYGENFQFVVQRASSEFVHFVLIGKNHSAFGGDAEFILEGSDGNVIQSAHGKIQFIESQNACSLYNVVWSIPHGTTARIRLKFNEKVRVTSWLKL